MQGTETRIAKGEEGLSPELAQRSPDLQCYRNDKPTTDCSGDKPTTNIGGAAKHNQEVVRGQDS